jgi:hypothetical protein
MEEGYENMSAANDVSDATENESTSSKYFGPSLIFMDKVRVNSSAAHSVVLTMDELQLTGQNLFSSRGGRVYAMHSLGY